ncbi:MAG: DUF1761 domain-containing protein [Candidatus Taylorbacteria bacterium]
MLTVILLALVGAVIAAVIGTLWYSDKTPMGRIHMRYLGFYQLSPEEQKKKIAEVKPIMWKMYVGQLILSFLTTFSVVFIITMSMRNGLSFGMSMMFVVMNWLCFMVPIIGSGILWGNCDRSIAWKKFLSDISSNLVTLIAVALLARLFV